MAIGTPVDRGTDTRFISTTDLTIASFTSAADEVIFVVVAISLSGAEPIISGHGSWTKLAADEYAGAVERGSLWACRSAGATSTITVEYSTTASIMSALAFSITGLANTGPVTNIVRQTTSSLGYGTAISASLPGADQFTLHTYIGDYTSVITPENTEINNFTGTYGSTCYISNAYNATGDETPTATKGVAGNWMVLAVELVSDTELGITNVDTDNIIAAEQTAVVLTGFGLTNVSEVRLKAGTRTEVITPGSVTGTSLAFDVSQGNLPFGTITCEIYDSVTTNTDSLAITLNTEAGNAYAVVVDPDTSEASIYKDASPAVVDDEVIEHTEATDVTLNPDGSFAVDAGSSVTSFDARRWVLSTETWEAFVTFPVGAGAEAETEVGGLIGGVVGNVVIGSIVGSVVNSVLRSNVALFADWTLGSLQGFGLSRSTTKDFTDYKNDVITAGVDESAFVGLRYESSVYHTDDEDGLPIPTTNNFGRNEKNIVASDWLNGASSIDDGVATDLGNNTGRVSLAGTGGRAFFGKTLSFVSGRTYCLSGRFEVESGALVLGTGANLKTFATTTDTNEVNISEGGLYQLIFTADATESKIVRIGLGIDGSRVMTVSVIVSELNCRDITYSVNQNAPSEEYYGISSYLTTNENTVSSNKVTELAGLPITAVRAYNSGVIFGDSFTNDAIDLGTNIRELTNGVAVSSEGVAGHTLAQALVVMQAYTIKPTDNFFLIEGGVNDIAQSSTDPTAQMKLDQAAMVAIAVENGLQYQVYTIAPWKNHVGWTVEKQGWLETYNAWIHSTYPVRRITDMYDILEDPSNADEMLAAYDSGDGLHPNAAGYLAVDTVTATKMSPNWRKGILLDSDTLLSKSGLSLTSFSGQFKFLPQFDSSDDKLSNLVMLSVNDGTTDNYVEVTYHQTTDVINLNRRVNGGGVETISTTVGELLYVTDDVLNVRIVSDNTRLSLLVNDSIVTSVTDVTLERLTGIEFNTAEQILSLSEIWSEAHSNEYLTGLT